MMRPVQRRLALTRWNTSGEPVEAWHRDRTHMSDRPYRCGYLQMMLYLTDVHEGTHCFSISPEPCDGPVLRQYTTIPTRLWCDHPDPEVRGFYSFLNTRSQKFAEAFG